MSRGQLDEKAIFGVARKIEPGEARLAYLQQVCGDDRGLFDRVVALAGMHDQQKSSLESPPSGVAATIAPSGKSQIGSTIGLCKLIEQIGEGGMGLVYMARQKEPIKRNVALKVIKPGMDSRQVVARFEAERQALALMDHPNIARVLDGGTTESGLPFFVMDLVRGVPITTYCGHQLAERPSLRRADA